MSEDLQNTNLGPLFFLSNSAASSSLSQNRNEKNNPEAQSTNQDLFENPIDSSCLFNISNKLVRIEYPGVVKNVDKAIETLGGLSNIESAVGDNRNKLELRFHPENKYNKPCCAENDSSTGVLLKVKKKPNTGNADNEETNYDYEVVGVSTLNYKFNRLCDFQYLPIIDSKDNDALSKDEYIYEKVLPDKLPTMEWFVSDEIKNQSQFIVPTTYARFDSSQTKLYLKTGEKYESSLRPDISKLMENTIRKKVRGQSTKQLSTYINFTVPNVQIPDQPSSEIMNLIKEKCMENFYKTVLKIFEERPAWTKVAVQYKTGLTHEHSKIILPAVAYFCHVGPWRMCWIKYGYNPQKDIRSRMFQTLDYRIRTAEGLKLIVTAKRNCSSRPLYYSKPSTSAQSSKSVTVLSNNAIVEERAFVLKFPYLPPARQMFYQFCDIHIPEIQEMISRLPKLPAGFKCDPKNGWLPGNFTEHCREIVNKYVMNSVQEELIEDSIKLKQKQKSQMEGLEADETKEISFTYCSQMLENIKKGIYKKVELPSLQTLQTSESLEETDIVMDLSDDESDEDQAVSNELLSFMPESLEENSDDERLSEGSDLEIDMEAVEEVNKLIAGTSDEDVNVAASFLKKI